MVSEVFRWRHCLRGRRALEGLVDRFDMSMSVEDVELALVASASSLGCGPARLGPSPDDGRLGVPCPHDPELRWLTVPSPGWGRRGRVRDTLLLLVSTVGPWRALAARLAQVERLALEDELTGLPNRRAAELMLTSTIAGARRHDRLVGLLFADLDHFKEVNDRFGHLVGDATLTEVGFRLRHAVRAEDVVARWGGDEFVIVVDSPTGVAGLTQVAEKVRYAVAAPRHLPDGTAHTVSVSVGGALFPAHAAEERALVAAADAALFTAKRAGRDRVVIADHTTGS